MAEKEYIDTAQLFKCETCYHMGGNGKCNSDCDAGESYRPAFSKLKIADVVEVVRCKDCEYWQDNNSGYPSKECRWGKDETPDSTDFCSYGKRKEEIT